MTSLPTEEFARLRTRWRTLLDGGAEYDPQDSDIQARIAGPNGIDDTARRNLETLRTEADRTVLWDDSSGDTQSDEITRNYERLRSMALAHNTLGSAFYNDTDLRATVIGALDWLHENRYFIREPYGNWFAWQIGVPLALCDTVVLLYEHLSEAQIAAWMAVVDSFTPEPRYTAANLVWTATVVAERAILVEDAAKAAQVSDQLDPALQYVESGDGFRRDGSFIQHDRLPYTGGYGAGLLGTLTRLLYLLADSTWAVRSPDLGNVYRWVYDSFEPVIFRGAMMDMVRGREISRETSQDHVVGQSIVGTISLLAESAPAVDRAAFRGMVKRWLMEDTYAPSLTRFSIATILRLKQILATVEPRPPLDTYKQFPQMDRAVAHRPDFAFGISMSSSRIYNFETNSFLKENTRGWYTADGMTYLYNSDLGQFSGDFWPTVDATRLPGITVDSTLPREPYSGQLYLSPRNWIGGTALGRYGVSGMDLAAWGASLVARKSWFVFGDMVVAVGSNISASDARPIETIVENRKIQQETAVLTVDGTTQTSRIPWAKTFVNVGWAHLATGVAEAEIGYYFVRGTVLRAKRESRTASWFEINEAFGSQTPVTRAYLSLAVNHGINPSDAGYAYVILPNRTTSEVEAFAESPSIAVLAQTAAAHAVKDTRHNVVGAAFWTNEPYLVAENNQPLITCEGQAAIMLCEADGELAVAIADPTQIGTRVNVVVHRAVRGLISADSGVSVSQSSEGVAIHVDVAGALGRTFNVRLRLALA